MRNAGDDVHAIDVAIVPGADAKDLIDSFFESAPALELARIELASECLRRRGLNDREYREDAHSDLSRSGVPRGVTGLLSPLDSNVARTEGYPHLVNDDRGSSGTIPAEVLEALSPSTSASVEIEIPGVATVGAKSEGCIADANRHLFGSIEGWLLVDQYIPATLRSLASKALASTPVRVAASNYERCMEAVGIVAVNPAVAAQQARDLFGERDAGKPPSRAQISMAARDASCQESSRVYAAIDRSLVDLATKWFLGNEEVLRKAVATREHAHSRAAHILDPRSQENPL